MSEPATLGPYDEPQHSGAIVADGPAERTRERLAKLHAIRRNAAIQFQAAVTDLRIHVHANTPVPVEQLVAACDAARNAFIDADGAVRAEQFQLNMIGLIGRRGDELPAETAREVEQMETVADDED